MKIRETYRKRRSALKRSGKARRQLPYEGIPHEGIVEEVHLPCDMNPEYRNFTFYGTFKKSFKALLNLSLDELEANGKLVTQKVALSRRSHFQERSLII